MTFWDTSAILPLLIEEADTSRRETQLLGDPEMVVWFGTPVEIESALCRRDREGVLPTDARRLVDQRLRALMGFWIQVNPTESVRARAVRLVRSHPLRAADAFQLAAALILCRDHPASTDFLTADVRLREAAYREGFRLVE